MGCLYDIVRDEGEWNWSGTKGKVRAVAQIMVDAVEDYGTQSTSAISSEIMEKVAEGRVVVQVEIKVDDDDWHPTIAWRGERGWVGGIIYDSDGRRFWVGVVWF